KLERRKSGAERVQEPASVSAGPVASLSAEREALAESPGLRVPKSRERVVGLKVPSPRSFWRETWAKLRMSAEMVTFAEVREVLGRERVAGSARWRMPRLRLGTAAGWARAKTEAVAESGTEVKEVLERPEVPEPEEVSWREAEPDLLPGEEVSRLAEMA